MGCGGSKEDTEASDAIDRELHEAKKVYEAEVKMLLLGSGESGKSTLAKQIRLIHMRGFSPEELAGYRASVFNNIVVCMRALLRAASDFDYELSSPAALDASARVRAPEFDILRAAPPPDLVAAVKTLWADEAIHNAFERQSEFQLYDCAAYLFENIDRIATPGYVPSAQDVLLTRVKTTGISEIEFTVQGVRFKLVDVGGQRSERRKWMHYFQDVTAVIFVVALSEYNQRLFEDGATNRMFESLKLFKEMCNNQWFTDTAMIVFLNKSDIFAEKIKKFPLSATFPEYTGGADMEKATRFISERFSALNTNPNKKIFFHVTCAMDTQMIEAIFNSVKDVVVRYMVAQQGAQI